jgi:hypothetical protein
MTKKEKQAKVARVLREFKAGTLKSSSGQPITNYKQAVAIALSEAGMSMKKKDASEEYMRAFIRQVLEEEEAMEEEEEMEGEECDTMDETAGEARCKGYLSALRKSRAKKR